MGANLKEAARWEELAARQGYRMAEAGLGMLYEAGRGVTLDYVSAYAWYARAAEGGDNVAGMRLKSLAKIMTARQIDEARRYTASLASSASHAEQAKASAGTSRSGEE